MEYVVEVRRTGMRRVFEVLETAADGDSVSRYFDIAIIALILANIGALVLETVPAFGQSYRPWFAGFEVISVAIFTVEYLGRVWSCSVDPRYSQPLRGRVRFATTPMAMVDLLAILPFFLPFLGVDLRFLRAARLFRIFRTAKLARYSESLRVFGSVMAAKKEQLVIVMSIIAFLTLIASY